MISIFFGFNGRLGRICEHAIKAIDPQTQILKYSRHDVWILEDPSLNINFTDVEMLKKTIRNKECIIFDCSADHQSTTAMIEHERKKQALILIINHVAIVTKYVGFSSGITLISECAIKPGNTHMQKYREVKLAQQDFVLKLQSYVFLPNIFTLIGHETYKIKSTCWAHILHKRVSQNGACTINDPRQKRSWVSETTIYEKLLVFLGAKIDHSLIGPLTDGVFQLEDIATTRLNGVIPPLKFTVGESSSWLVGDYCQAGEFKEKGLLDVALLASMSSGCDLN